MNFPDHASVNAQTGFLLKKVSAASFERFAAVTGEYGLHPMHFGMLMMIDTEGPCSQQHLSVCTGIDTSSMVVRVDALEELGLVERKRSVRDRRSYELKLTRKGQKLLEELRGKAAEHGAEFFSPLTQPERERLHELLAKLAASLD